MMRAVEGRATRRRARSMPWWRTARGEEQLVGYGFLVPDLLGLFVFLVIPIIGAFWVSFHHWTGIGDATWAGLDNYRAVLRDEQFRDALKVTATYVVLFVPVFYATSLALAMLIHQNLRLGGLFRTAYFLPFMFSLVISSVVWQLLLDERAGPINRALDAVGIGAQPWLGSSRQALVAVVIVTLWQGIGYGMIVFLAGLQDIPRVYYEAARVDGASGWRQFRHVTLPMLKPTSAFIVVISFITAIQVFDPVYILTQGGPDKATTTAVFYIYQQGFKFLQFGYASALSVCLFALILFFTMIQLRLFRTDDGLG